MWELAQVREDAVLGEGCIIGRGAYVGTGVQIGDNVKLQNYALVYEPRGLGDGVFVGPAVVLTNDLNPRSVDPSGRRKSGHDWEAVGVTVETGASLGARSVCVAPVRIGRWAMVAAGRRGDQGRAGPRPGRRCPGPPDRLGGPCRRTTRRRPARSGRCPQTGERYRETAEERRAGARGRPS